jgi:D-alanyl-lipoteichoic acid acyltransferase DltB (MBOAT superfamily)
MRRGLLQFGWGLFKKAVVADRLALYVNPVFDNIEAYGGLTLLLAAYAYSFQIYYDFSGYTDMALGVARLFNIDLTQNFNRPYLATSVADFWRRWHISFSRWILDYIFRPLQMQLRDWRTAGVAAALVVTFLVSGIWHGVGWGFVCWGLIHGLAMAAGLFWRPVGDRLFGSVGLAESGLRRVIRVAFTFHVIVFSWIFFRAATVSDAVLYLRRLGEPAWRLRDFLFMHGNTELAVLFLAAGTLFVVFLGAQRQRMETWRLALPLAPRWAAYGLLALAILLFAVDTETAFIYMQF